ncbi:MAG: hypothetical protein KA239_08070 [Bacteroidia bacterium]|nr:hypothetical protein [Bacteroidia bacterium]
MSLKRNIQKEPDQNQSTQDLEPIFESVKMRIERGEEQIRNGNTKTKAQVDERFDQWLRSR